VLRAAGCRGEKICFIMDESNVLDTGFLERLNTLLANGEVPGLFEGDEHTTLMTQIKEGAARDGHMLDSQEELYKWFTAQVCFIKVFCVLHYFLKVIKNLHVVFTMNPSSEGLRDRASTSPALFNRCVLNWFGDWSDSALYQVGRAFTTTMDIDKPAYNPPGNDDRVVVFYFKSLFFVAGGFPYSCDEVPKPPTYRDAIVNAMVFVHQTLHRLNCMSLAFCRHFIVFVFVVRLSKRGQRTMAITPRHYLDFISHFTKLYTEKREELESQQLHLNNGLGKIRETETQVCCSYYYCMMRFHKLLLTGC
jgi:dynein heavy chain 1